MNTFHRKQRQLSGIISAKKKDDTDQTRVLCQQCLASVATAKGNTTNFFDH